MHEIQVPKQPLPLREFVRARIGQTWSEADAREVERQLDRIDALAAELGRQG